jgi:hypothetical protein
MSIKIYALLFFIFLVVQNTTFAQDEDLSSSVESTRTVIGVPSISYEEYLQQNLRDNNIDHILPGLDFPGYKSVHWGMHKKMYSLEDQIVFGEKMTIEPVFDKSERVIAISRKIIFDKKVPDKKKLNLYRRFIEKLENEYGYPSHPIAPEAIVGNNDAFLSKLVSEYRVEWHGPANEVSISLNENYLQIENRKPERYLVN